MRERGPPLVTQHERILRHLKEVGSLTQAEAMQDYGIARLSARISELKSAGYPIRREMVAERNRYQEPVSYARYFLERNQEA